MLKKIKMFMVLAVLASPMGCSPVYAKSTPLVTGSGVLVKVVDGDTLKLNVNGTIANYRLALVDTPETYNNIKAKKDLKLCKISKTKMFALGIAAKNYVKHYYKIGDTVSYTIVGTGKYRRPIIWIDRLIYKLIVGGYGRVVNYHNVSSGKVTMGQILENIARRKKLGIWAQLDTCW